MVSIDRILSIWGIVVSVIFAYITDKKTIKIIAVIVLIACLGFMIYSLFFDTNLKIIETDNEEQTVVGIKAEYTGNALRQGESLKLKDVTVIAILENGESIEIQDFDAYPTEGFAIGENIVTVIYGHHETSITVLMVKDKIIVTFDPQGGTCDQNEITINYDNTIPELPIPSRHGYMFMGWYLDSVYEKEITQENIIHLLTNDTTLHAYWEGYTYNIVFNSNDGSGETYSETYRYGEEKKLLANSFGSNNMTFIGWSTNADSETAEYMDVEAVLNLTQKENDTINLYAIWRRNPTSVLTAHVSDSGTYKAYKNNGDSFRMFGIEYNRGFTIKVAAKYNMWGGGTQYATFNLAELAMVGDYLNMAMGTVDGEGTGEVYVRVYLDKTTADDYDYEFYITNQLSPETQRIRIKDKSSMTIQVVNQSGNILMIGFANLEVVN